MNCMLLPIHIMSGKKRTYNDAFLKMGSTSIDQNSVVKPQCVICAKVLSRESMKPIKAHFEACHSNQAGKEFDYFKRKETSLKANRIDSTGRCAHQNEAALEASYRIALRIARTKSLIASVKS